MQLISRIVMKGNCKEAIEFYKKAFNISVDYIITYGSVGAGSEEDKDLIMNCQIDLAGSKIHLADHKPEKVMSGNQISYSVVMDNPDEVKEAFEKLKEGSQVIMEPVETFFSPCHCVLTDKFGVMWQINCPKK